MPNRGPLGSEKPTPETQSPQISLCGLFFNDTATTEIYTLSLHDALPISGRRSGRDQPRTTLPALMHEVQTLSFLGVLPTSARTVWMLGFQRRRVRRCECETDMPKPGPL